MEHNENTAKCCYNKKERELVKAYIMEQYADTNDNVEIVPSTISEISIVKITAREHITYITLGAGAYTIQNKFRKDMQNFELVMVASSDITETQDEYIKSQLPIFVTQCYEKGETINETDAIVWSDDKESLPFCYNHFMLLQSAEPLSCGKNTIQFMVMLPLFSQEAESLMSRIKGNRLFSKNPISVVYEHKGKFLKMIIDCECGKQVLLVDMPRELIKYFGYNVAESTFGYSDLPFVPWGIVLRDARNLGHSFWQNVRGTTSIKPKQFSVSKNWKYEDCDGGIVITSYIGEDLDVTIPEAINGKPVVKLGWLCFSPEANGAEHSRVKETRKLIRRVKLPRTIKYLERIFCGCHCLEEVVFDDNLEDVSSHVFNGCVSLKTNEYENTIYLGTKQNPYYLVIGTKADNVKLHPNTKVIASRALLNCTVEVPAAIECFAYSTASWESKVTFKVTVGSSAHKYCISAGYDFIEI